MTDMPTTPDSLLATYEAGVKSPAAGDATPWLEARSHIEPIRADLTTDQAKRLEAADRMLVQNAEYVTMPEGATAHPRSEWWWYADVLGGAVPAAPAKPTGNTIGRIFTGIEVVVLLIAVFLLLRNFGVQPFAGMFQPATPPTPTQAPTLTPAPTATIDLNAFDMSKATVYSAPQNVIQMSVPPSWTPPVPNPASPYSYTFLYGAQASPQAIINISLIDTKDFYTEVDPTGKAKSITEALNLIKINNTQAGSPTSPKFGDVVAGKIGKLDAQTLTVQTAGNIQQGTQPSQITLLAADVEGGARVVYIQSQYNVGSDPRIKDTIQKMLDTLVVSAGNIPTATPTATLHPLLVTATALGNEIIALTPTNTATPTATITNTPGAGTPTGAPGTITASGLKIEDLTVGTGALAEKGKTVSVKYRGTLLNGTEFDSSYGKTPDTYDVTLGAGQVIKGWDEGLVGMKVGGKRRLTIPPELAYGAQAQGAKIPANSTLVFEVELVNVK